MHNDIYDHERPEEQASARGSVSASGTRGDETGFDEYLGSSAGRYFGSGYRRVGHSVGELLIESDASGVRIIGSGVAAYPVDWSSGQSGASRAPHLSTIDAIVLAVFMAEAYLRHVDNLSENLIADAWLSDVDIKAGAVPWEQLDSIPMSCSRADRGVTDDGVESTFTVRIATMKVVMRVRHSDPLTILPGETGVGQAIAATAQTAGPMTDAYRYTAHRSALKDTAATAGVSLMARHFIEPDITGRKSGIASSYWPSATVIDCLVIASQMAQVLIFSAPGLSRHSVSNLWMRRARFSASTPPGGAVDGMASLNVVGGRSFDRGSEGTLHSVDVQCPDLFGFTASASLAFMAPKSSNASAVVSS